MTHAGERAVIAGRDLDVLIRERPVADHAEHLRTLEHQPNRPAGLFRGHGGEHDMRPRRALASKTTADKRAEHAHILFLDAERFRDRAACAGDALSRVVEGEVWAVPAS